MRFKKSPVLKEQGMIFYKIFLTPLTQVFYYAILSVVNLLINLTGKDEYCG